MFYKGKKILVIGGTGEIGKTLIRRLLIEEPKLIRVFSRDEYKQFLLQHEIVNSNVQFSLGDVRNYERIKDAMKDMDYVFHLAAMKHVPACELNPFEAVMTNVIGTENVIRAAKSQQVKKLIFTSSDKSISPTNTYGATKLIAERMISANDFNLGEPKNIIASVRFGNVLGSRGSVIPLFKNQIIEQSKITVTDMNMSRFMMTLEQASNLLMKSLELACGGEVFVLKMPVIILKDLSHVMIEEVCAKYNINLNTVKVQQLGLRPGEKMYEELMTLEESKDAFELQDLYVITRNEQSNYQTLDHANPAVHSTYSSHNQPPLTKEEVRKLLKDEELI